MDLTALAAQVTCPVCRDIYQDPLELACRHTVCYCCIKRLITSGHITCPECRHSSDYHQLTKDFKLQAVTEWYKAQVGVTPLEGDGCPPDLATPSKKSAKCVQCEQEKVALYCFDCRMSFCDVCARTHSSVSRCSPSSCCRVDMLHLQYTKLYHADMQAVQEIKKELNIELQEKLASCASDKEQALLEVEAAENSLVLEVKRHFLTQKAAVEVNHKDCVKQTKRQYRKRQLELDRLYEYINSKRQHIDSTTVVQNYAKASGDITHRLSALRNQRMKKYSIKIDKKESNAQAFDRGLALTCSVAETDETVDKEANSIRFTKMLNRPFSQQWSKNIAEKVIKMIKVKNFIWCLTKDKIMLYTRTGDYYMTIRDVLMQDSNRDMIQTSAGHVLVATTKSGLLLFIDGKYSSTVDEGSFWSLSSNNNDIYACRVECDKGIFVHTYRELNGSYAKVSQVLSGIKHSKPCLESLSCVYGRNSLLVCSSGRHNICQLDSSMQITKIYGSYGNTSPRLSSSFDNMSPGQPFSPAVCSYGNTSPVQLFSQAACSYGNASPGQLSSPTICCVDDEGSLLVADGDNSRLQLLHPPTWSDEEGWSVMDLPPEFPRPTTAAIDQETGSLYVAGAMDDDGYVLQMYNPMFSPVQPNIV